MLMKSSLIRSIGNCVPQLWQFMQAGNSTWSQVQHIRRILVGNGFEMADMNVKIRTVKRE